MRSHVFFWGGVSILVFAIVGSCRQSQSTIKTAPLVPREISALSSRQSSLSKPQSSASQSAPASTADDSQAVDLDQDFGKIAAITAQSADSEINVRSGPTQDADILDYGLVGDVVSLGRSEIAEDGQTWHFVTFQNKSTAGWIRSDFLEIQTSLVEEDEAATSDPQEDLLKEALDEYCGGPQKISAYFTTQNYTIYLCKLRDSLLYLSQEKGISQITMVEDAQAIGGGYIIVNGSYEYHLDSSAFVVTRIDDKGEEIEVLREAVIYSERY